MDAGDRVHGRLVERPERERAGGHPGPVEFLEEKGPALRRPFVGAIETSRHPNMKELIPMGGNIRILFAFDPRRAAILLIGGDKTDRWNEWYEEMVPVADDLYDDHLRTLRASGEIE